MDGRSIVLQTSSCPEANPVLRSTHSHPGPLDAFVQLLLVDSKTLTRPPVRLCTQRKSQLHPCPHRAARTFHRWHCCSSSCSSSPLLIRAQYSVQRREWIWPPRGKGQKICVSGNTVRGAQSLPKGPPPTNAALLAPRPLPPHPPDAQDALLRLSLIITLHFCTSAR
jgi:hypothetical protein